MTNATLILEKVRAAVRQRNDMFYTPPTKEAMEEWFENQPATMPTTVAVMIGMNYALKQIEDIISTERWRVVWRLGGGSVHTTVVSCRAETRPDCPNDWVAAAITQISQSDDFDPSPFNNPEDWLAERLARAFDVEYSNYRGFDCIGVFNADAVWFEKGEQ